MDYEQVGEVAEGFAFYAKQNLDTGWTGDMENIQRVIALALIQRVIAKAITSIAYSLIDANRLASSRED